MGTKCSNVQAYGGHYHSNCHGPLQETGWIQLIIYEFLALQTNIKTLIHIKGLLSHQDWTSLRLLPCPSCPGGNSLCEGQEMQSRASNMLGQVFYLSHSLSEKMFSII